MEKFRDEVSIIRLGQLGVKHARAYMTRKKNPYFALDPFAGLW